MFTIQISQYLEKMCLWSIPAANQSEAVSNLDSDGDFCSLSPCVNFEFVRSDDSLSSYFAFFVCAYESAESEPQRIQLVGIVQGLYIAAAMKCFSRTMGMIRTWLFMTADLTTISAPHQKIKSN